MDRINVPDRLIDFDRPYNCYVMLAVSRKKDTPHITNSQEIVFREVVKSKNEIVRKYNKIIAQAKNYVDEQGTKYPFYIYITVNPRDSLKASFILRQQVDNWLQETINGSDCSKQFKKLNGHFISALMKPESKAGRLFIVDLDDKERKDSVVDNLINAGVLIHCVQETRHGYHIVTSPFKRVDKNLSTIVSDDIEIKKDGLLFVEYIENQGDKTYNVTPCWNTTFNGVPCMETDLEYGFFKSKNDMRPGHSIWLKKEQAERLYNLFMGD